MFTLVFAFLSVIFAVAFTVVLIRLTAVKPCQQSDRILLPRNPTARLAKRWTNDTIVKFSRRYQTLHDNEV